MAKKPKPDVYQRVTDRIIELLEKGVVPWQNPVTSTMELPKNFSTGKAYRGINVFLLASMRYASPWWLTYKQAQELGGQVRKGEKGAFVVKFGTYTKENPEAKRKEDQEETRFFLKHYIVFNAAQIDGINFPSPAPMPEKEQAQQSEDAEAIIAGMPNPPKHFEGRKAIPCYNKLFDQVDMPDRRLFSSIAEFYLAFFHELTHATGHEKRLARKTLIDNKGMAATGEARKTYSEEELVAEMGAAFLLAHAGILHDNHESSASYLQGWLKVLKAKENKRWIVKAAAQAQKASDYILNAPPA
jgi:antirestriction protein ArdC